jgi:hypothetical protein
VVAFAVSVLGVIACACIGLGLKGGSQRQGDQCRPQVDTHLQTRQSRVEAASHSSSTPFSCAILFRCCCRRSRSALRLSGVRFVSFYQRSHIFRGSEQLTSKPADVGVRVRVKSRDIGSTSVRVIREQMRPRHMQTHTGTNR